jgi:hypothetical protein
VRVLSVGFIDWLGAWLDFRFTIAFRVFVRLGRSRLEADKRNEDPSGEHRGVDRMSAASEK